MTPSQEYFRDHKYVFVKNILDPEICIELSGYLRKITASKVEGDVQCPISPSIYGDKVFDTLLEDLRPAMEEATGLKLIPTYSYARFYKPGDELKPHLDRRECEISATVTLGFNGGLWPIHVSSSREMNDDLGEFMVEVGDALIYRGEELNHWREKYTQGEWQCQVFLHYVDADGPYKDLKFDGRESLGLDAKHKKTQLQKKREKTSPYLESEFYFFGNTQREKHLWLYKEDFISDGLIDLIEEYAAPKVSVARIGYGSDNEEVDKSIRNASAKTLPPDKFEWLYRLVEKEIYSVNMTNYKYVLDGLEHMTYIEYRGGIEEPGKYGKHTDGAVHMTRKLSFSVQLSDPSEYEGGDLIIWQSNNRFIVPKKKGLIVFFPSYVDHEVTPVTRGLRKSLVAWIHGPHFC